MSKLWLTFQVRKLRFREISFTCLKSLKCQEVEPIFPSSFDASACVVDPTVKLSQCTRSVPVVNSGSKYSIIKGYSC